MKLKFLCTMLLAGALGAAAQGGYQDGVDNFNAGRLDVAKTILQNTINDGATNKAVSYYYLGSIDFLENNMAAAKANFDKGVQADPNYGRNYIGLGEVALKGGDKGAAEGFFKQATGTDKKNTALVAEVARAYYNVDPVKYDKEIQKNLEKARKDSKNTEAAVYLLQGDMIGDKDPGEAAGLYELAIEQSKLKGEVNREAYVKYANVYFSVAPTFAIKKLEELNQLEPNSALAQRELAEKYYANNQWGSAYQQYGKYLQNPNHFQKDERRYVQLLVAAKEYAQAVDRANAILAQDPSDYAMYRMILLSESYQNKWPEAEAAGAKLFQIAKPEQLVPNDYIVYGQALSEQKKVDEAVAVYEKAIELNPDAPELLTDLSAVYEKAGQNEKAVETMKRYLDTGAGSTNDLVNMARRYNSLARSLEKGTPERAAAATEGIKYIDMAIAKVPDNGTVYRIKGELQLAKNDDKPDAETAATYEKMIELYDVDPANREKYATSYRAADFVLSLYYIDVDKEKARKYITDYLTYTPDDENFKLLLESLDK